MRSVSALITLCLALVLAVVLTGSKVEAARAAPAPAKAAAATPAAPVDAQRVLADAQAYAAKILNAAVEQGRTIIADATLKAVPLVPSGSKSVYKVQPVDEDGNPIVPQSLATSNAIAHRAHRAAKTANLIQSYLPKTQRKFISHKLVPDALGQYGATALGAALSNSNPDPYVGRKGTRRLGKRGYKKLDIYGRKRSCLKDIAAHFDEKDVYESKKSIIKRQLEVTRDHNLAEALRRQLSDLENWHQMMQRQFASSSAELVHHERVLQGLFATYLPKFLKKQLNANKMARRLARPLPYPEAREQALRYLRRIRFKIGRAQRLKDLYAGKFGDKPRKRMVEPHYVNRDFPSKDPISSQIRERQYRRVIADKHLSTNPRHLEAARNLIRKSRRQHEDWMASPLAEPLVRNKLYHPHTEKLGVPDFLRDFPWQVDRTDDMVNENTKFPVKQTERGRTW